METSHDLYRIEIPIQSLRYHKFKRFDMFDTYSELDRNENTKCHARNKYIKCHQLYTRHDCIRCIYIQFTNQKPQFVQQSAINLCTHWRHFGKLSNLCSAIGWYEYEYIIYAMVSIAYFGQCMQALNYSTNMCTHTNGKQNVCCCCPIVLVIVRCVYINKCSACEHASKCYNI